MSDAYPNARCDGQVLTIEEETELRRAYEDRTKQGEEQARLDNDRRLKDAPAKLRGMPKDEFCVAFGQAIRGVWIDSVGVSKEVLAMAKAEAVRRKLSLNQSLVRAEKVRIGMTECELYASWGLPEKQNRSVGAWGIHTQHVFGSFGAYVYTQNGRVTSWQD